MVNELLAPLLPETAGLSRAVRLQDFDHNYLAIGRVAEALLRMAGKDADAYRIHPPTREVDLNLTGVARSLPFDSDSCQFSEYCQMRESTRSETERRPIMGGIV